MRRYVWVPMAVLALTLGACSTGAAKAPRTLTQIVTVTGTSPAPTDSSGADGSAGITVLNPNGSGSASGTATGSTGSTGAKTPTTGAPTTKTAKTTHTTKSKPKVTKKTTSKAKVVKVNPLQVSCPSLLDAHDIKKALGAKVSSSNFRIVDVANPDVKMTGKVKCYYGAKSSSKSRPVTVALAQYKSGGAAKGQMNVTVKSETSLGADTSTVKVSGHQAHVLLRDGGLLVMQYDTWTLSVAVDKGVVANKKLPSGLQSLARMVLARVLKNG